MIDLERYTLANGLTVVLNQDRSAPLVAVNLWYHVGSKDEKPGRTGFAHLFEHMLFSGSENVGNNEHFRYVQSVGGVLNGSTTFDRTNYFETLPSNYLALGLWLESDRLGYFLPALTQEKLDIQKNVVKEERRLRYDNAPYGTAFENLLRIAYPPDFPYHWPTIGSMEDLDAATLDDIREFFSTWYAPNNAVLTLVGDFDTGEAKDLVERYFGEIPRGGDVPRESWTLAPAAGEQRERVAGPVQLPRIYRLYHVPPVGAGDWFEADLLSSVLGHGRASRLERSLVYDRQIAQDAAAFVFPSEATGILVLWATAKEDVDVDVLEAALDEEIDQRVAEGPTEREVARARNQATSEFAHQIEDYGARADLIGMFATFFGEPELANGWMERYAALRAQEVHAAARRYLVPGNRVTLHFVPGDGAITGGVA
jgi:zinc protease